MKTLSKILIVGDAYIPTGYSRVIRSIFEPLAQKYKLCQMAIRYNGEPHDYPWQLIRANKTGDPYGFDQLGPLAEAFNPEIIFILYDINFQGKYFEILKSYNLKAKIVCYSPVESGPIPIEVVKTKETPNSNMDCSNMNKLGDHMGERGY